MRLSGKVALVTGAGQGIGRGIALRLAQEGADLVAVDINPETAGGVAEEVRAMGRRAVALTADLSKVEEIRRMVGEAVEALSRIDILINNAGRVQVKPMLDLTEEDWDRVVDVNMKGLFFCLQAVAKHMIERKIEGRIINMSSIAAGGGRPVVMSYAASKIAVISITRSAALDLAPYRITVNALCPGIVDTPMWKQIDAERAQVLGLPIGEPFRRMVEAIPLGRAAVPEDVAGVAAFLVSDDGAYITGQAINVCGGISAPPPGMVWR